jgi:uncharacterized membrane protein YbjE (DUF340 family)
MTNSFFKELEIFHVYIIVFIILSISLLYHVFIYDHEHPNNVKHAAEKQKKKTYMDYINTAHAGLIRGLIFGIILGDMGVYTGIKNAAIYGMVNPLFLSIGY